MLRKVLLTLMLRHNLPVYSSGQVVVKEGTSVTLACEAQAKKI